jgi:hypothetical protein
MLIPPPGVIRNSGLHFDQSIDLPVQRKRRCAYSLPESILITLALKIPDMIWIGEVFGLLISSGS